MPATLRPFKFERADYEKLIAIQHVIAPDYKDVVEDRMRSDQVRPHKCHLSRYLIEVGDEVIGSAEIRHSADAYHPDKYRLNILLLPNFQGLGYGNQAYEHLLAELIERNALSVRANTRLDHERPLRFLQDRGFQEVERSWESILDPTQVNWSEWTHYVDLMAAQGVELTTLANLADDPKRNFKFYELVEQLEDDVPGVDAREPMTYETFERVHMQNPKLDETLQFVAIKHGEYVAYSALWADEFDPHKLWTGLTGVTRPHRKQSIASAIKVAAIQEAQARGVTQIHTWNEVNNRGMLTINERFGFVKKPAWLSLLKTLQ